MSINRFAKMRDANEAEIVAALRSVGATVTQLGQHGVPDLLVGFRGATFLLEVKAPPGARGGTKHNHAELTSAQKLWWATWSGRPPAIVRTAAEALKAIGATT